MDLPMYLSIALAVTALSGALAHELLGLFVTVFKQAPFALQASVTVASLALLGMAGLAGAIIVG